MRLILSISRLILVTAVFLVALKSEARRAVLSDLSSVNESEVINVTVQASGRFKYTRELTLKINNDHGRDKQSLQTITFNGRSEKLRVLAARTINGVKSQDVDLKKNMEIKEVGDFGSSFDRIKQAAITYPNVGIGSKIYLKYQIERTEVPFDNFYSANFGFAGDWIENYKVSIRSQLPLYHWVQDSEGLLKLTSGKAKDGWHLTEFQTLRAINTVAVQEEGAYFRPERTPLVAISSLQTWDKFGAEKIPVHEKLLSGSLPLPLEKIRSEAAKETTVIGKLQKVTALISQEFRYFGDWRRRNGGNVPRSLKEIADTRYGDCKDLSLAVTAIYRALGFKANLAWVWRGSAPVHQKGYELPVETYFNHAIARVEAESSVYWIDATNPVSFARSTFADIAGRPAFVLDPEKPRLDPIPPVQAGAGRFHKDLVYELQPDSSIEVSGSYSALGRAAIGLTIDSFYTPKQASEWGLVKAMAGNARVLKYAVGDFERRSRVVDDVKVPLKYTIDDIGLRTSAGLGFALLREDVVGSMMLEPRDRISDIYLEQPSERWADIEIRGVKRIGKHSLDCAIESEWAKLSRKVLDTDKGIRIEDRVAVLAQVIPNEKLQIPEFAKFQSQVRECFNRAAIILERR